MDETWIDLLNSDYHDYLGTGRDEDRLLNRRWLGRFLARWSLAPGPHVVSPLSDLRTLIRRMTDRAINGKTVSSKDWERLNMVLASSPVVRRIKASRNKYQMELVSTDGGIEPLLADIAASFAEVFTNGDPTRIKMCENEDCRWVMYDRSKNRSRRWCESNTGCGNMMKVRRHRALRKKV